MSPLDPQWSFYSTNTSVFQQRFKERLGSQWAHITSQPEVDEAIKQVEDLHKYFEKMEKLIGRQVKAMQKLNDVDTEVALYYQQEGYLILIKFG